MLIFGEKYLTQSIRLLEGGWVEILFGRIPFEHAVSLHGASLRLQSGPGAWSNLRVLVIEYFKEMSIDV